MNVLKNNMNNSDLDNLFGDNTQETHDKQDNDIVQKEDINSNKSAPELLNNEQKTIILKRWQESDGEQDENKIPSIEELCELAWPGMKYNGQHKQGRAIKKFLAEHDLKPKTKTEYTPKGLLSLSAENKEYILNNPNMRALEISKILFNNPNLTNRHQETLTILNYQKELEKEGGYKKEIKDDEISEEYRPPKKIEESCARINRNVNGANFDYKKLTPTQKKCCQMLMSYLGSLRFSHHLNLINNADDRRLYENTYIKYIYDKTDLSQEDLDQYLTLANEAVMESSIKRTIAMLEEEQQRERDEQGKMSMSIVETLKISRDEYNSCIKRQQGLYKALEVERSKRLNERIGPQFTLLNIVEEMKNEEKRKALVAEAEKRNDKLKDEIKRLSGLDELICRIYGVDEDLVING